MAITNRVLVELLEEEKKLYSVGAKYPLWRLSRLQNPSRRYINNYIHTKLLNSTPPQNESRK